MWISDQCGVSGHFDFSGQHSLSGKCRLSGQCGLQVNVDCQVSVDCPINVDCHVNMDWQANVEELALSYHPLDVHQSNQSSFPASCNCNENSLDPVMLPPFTSEAVDCFQCSIKSMMAKVLTNSTACSPLPHLP